jgi:hypothetical protein
VKPVEGDRSVLMPAGFADGVMAAVLVAPRPTPTRSFVSAVRARRAHDALAALWVAWHLGTVHSSHVAPPVRARSFALVLAVATILTTGSLAAAAAVGVVVPASAERPPAAIPAASGIDELGPAQRHQTGVDQPADTEGSAPTDDPVGTDADGLPPNTGDKPGEIGPEDRDDPNLDEQPGPADDDDADSDEAPGPNGDANQPGPYATPDPDDGTADPNPDPTPEPDLNGGLPGDGDGDSDDGGGSGGSGG